MIKNYFLIAFRSLAKQFSFSFLNISGLAIGITSAALIFLWIEDEVTFSDYFDNKDNLYQVFENQTYNGETFTFAALPGPFAPAIEKEIPGIKHAVRASWGARILFTKEDKSIYGDGLHVEPAFMTMFNFEFIHGNAASALNDLHSVVMSDRMAKKIFNQVDVVGKKVKLDNDQEYVITGVFKPLPENCRFQKLDFYIPFEIQLQNNEWMRTSWGSNSLQTFVTLHPEADVRQVNAKLKEFITDKEKEATAKPFLLSAHDWRLRSEFKQGIQEGGRIRFVKLFSLIAWIILLLACINFMNLSTSRSEKRAREVGVRKVLGSDKSSLVAQYIIESIVMSMLAVVIAMGITYLILPAFNNLVDKNIQLHLFKPSHIFFALGLGLLSGLVAGSYPALYLSSFNPIEVLKSLKLSNRLGVVFIRKGLVISQFIVSVALITSTLIIYQQVIHTKNRDLGINKNNLIYFSRQLITLPQQGDIALRFSTFKNDLISSGLVENAAMSNSTAFQIGSSSSGFKWKGKEEDKDVLISMQWASKEYVKTMGMQVSAGRDFYQEGEADSSSIIINESFAKVMNMKPDDAVGQLIDRENEKLTVVGVIKDFVFNNIYGKATPLIIFNDRKAMNAFTVNIRFAPGVDYNKALAKTEEIVKKYNPAYPFEYEFVDEKFEELFEGENLIGKLAGVFAGLAIFISCLGLFGLAAYSAEKRIKEIGIRKVLGASVSNLTALLSKEFILLVLVSCLVAFPVAFLMMNNWLKSYEYRVRITWWMFVLPGITALLIALLTVSIQAIKAAISNPIRSLRTE